jgi:hypothetical protein
VPRTALTAALGEREMSPISQILRWMRSHLRNWRYVGRGQTFRRLDGDVVFVISFQKSRWGKRFFMNLGAQPLGIPDQTEAVPATDTIAESDCVFRSPVALDWKPRVSRAHTRRLVAAMTAARAAFEASVLEIRALSRAGSVDELLKRQSYAGSSVRAAFVLARLLAADGHRAAAAPIVMHVVVQASEEPLLRRAAERLAEELRAWTFHGVERG